MYICIYIYIYICISLSLSEEVEAFLLPCETILCKGHKKPTRRGPPKTPADRVSIPDTDDGFWLPIRIRHPCVGSCSRLGLLGLGPRSIRRNPSPVIQTMTWSKWCFHGHGGWDQAGHNELSSGQSVFLAFAFMFCTVAPCSECCPEAPSLSLCAAVVFKPLGVCLVGNLLPVSIM